MNREIVGGAGAAVYPLTGDVTSTAGNPLVTVTGLQHIPILNASLASGAVLEFNANNNQWQGILRANVLVDGLVVSTDNIIAVNADRPITVDGV